jgi:hypothetical protein
MAAYAQGSQFPKGPDYVNMSQWGQAEHERRNPTPTELKAEQTPAPDAQTPKLQFFEDQTPAQFHERETPENAAPSREGEDQKPKLEFHEDKYRELRLEHSRTDL